MTRSDPTQRWTIPQIIRRSCEVLREEGLWNLWVKILGETVYRRALLLERHLDDPLPEGSSRLAVTVRALKENEIAAYADFQPGADLSDVRKRWKNGHRCYAALLDDRIIYALWCVSENAWIDYLGSRLRLNPGEVYLYESFTRPEYRGQNIPVILVMHAFQKLREDGFRRGVAVVVPENRPARRHAEKGGYRHCGWIGYYKLGPWRSDFIRMFGDTPKPGETSL